MESKIEIVHRNRTYTSISCMHIPYSGKSVFSFVEPVRSKFTFEQGKCWLPKQYCSKEHEMEFVQRLTAEITIA